MGSGVCMGSDVGMGLVVLMGSVVGMGWDVGKAFFIKDDMVRDICSICLRVKTIVGILG